VKYKTSCVKFRTHFNPLQILFIAQICVLFIGLLISFPRKLRRGFPIKITETFILVITEGFLMNVVSFLVDYFWPVRLTPVSLTTIRNSYVQRVVKMQSTDSAIRHST
jgi:hypothetical protein